MGIKLRQCGKVIKKVSQVSMCFPLMFDVEVKVLKDSLHSVGPARYGSQVQAVGTVSALPPVSQPARGNEPCGVWGLLFGGHARQGLFIAASEARGGLLPS